jgi:hypothetical protein
MRDREGLFSLPRTVWLREEYNVKKGVSPRTVPQTILPITFMLYCLCSETTFAFITSIKPAEIKMVNYCCY